jgi:hypothetical protein
MIFCKGGSRRAVGGCKLGVVDAAGWQVSGCPPRSRNTSGRGWCLGCRGCQLAVIGCQLAVPEHVEGTD